MHRYRTGYSYGDPPSVCIVVSYGAVRCRAVKHDYCHTRFSCVYSMQLCWSILPSSCFGLGCYPFERTYAALIIAFVLRQLRNHPLERRLKSFSLPPLPGLTALPHSLPPPRHGQRRHMGALDSRRNRRSERHRPFRLLRQPRPR